MQQFVLIISVTVAQKMLKTWLHGMYLDWGVGTNQWIWICCEYSSKSQIWTFRIIWVEYIQTQTIWTLQDNWWLTKLLDKSNYLSYIKWFKLFCRCGGNALLSKFEKLSLCLNSNTSLHFLAPCCIMFDNIIYPSHFFAYHNDEYATQNIMDSVENEKGGGGNGL